MEANGQLHGPAALSPGEQTPVTIGEDAGWTPEPVMTLWRREKSLDCAGNRTRSGNWTPAVHPVAHRYTEWAILASKDDLNYNL
jgi:hypothetical protein